MDKPAESDYRAESMKPFKFHKVIDIEVPAPIAITALVAVTAISLSPAFMIRALKRK